jgi:hypothetical protein
LFPSLKAGGAGRTSGYNVAKEDSLLSAVASPVVVTYLFRFEYVALIRFIGSLRLLL